MGRGAGTNEREHTLRSLVCTYTGELVELLPPPGAFGG